MTILALEAVNSKYNISTLGELKLSRRYVRVRYSL